MHGFFIHRQNNFNIKSILKTCKVIFEINLRRQKQQFN